jgi:hypothetical protein
MRLWLSLLFVLASPAWSGAMVSFQMADAINGSGNCSGSASDSLLASLTVPGSCAAAGLTFEASANGWTASVTEVGPNANNYSGSVDASAGSDPTAVILGGTGSGYLLVQYTDTIKFNAPGGTVQASPTLVQAGDLSIDYPCVQSDDYCVDTSLSDSFWSKWIPFTFGDELDLPALSASFNTSFVEGYGGDFTVTEAITAFQIVDANMNLLPDAYAAQVLEVSAEQTPEPSFFYAVGMAILVFAVRRTLAGRHNRTRRW